MKQLQAYLAEGEKTYEFRLKTIVELSDDQLDKMETHLRKYEAFDIGSPKRTIMQSKPLDFHEAGPNEVFIIDFKTKLPMSPAYALTELVQLIGIAEKEIRLNSTSEPREIENTIRQSKDLDAKSTAKLLDTDYSDAEDVDGADYHGEQHLTKFMKELQDTKVGLGTEYKVK